MFVFYKMGAKAHSSALLWVGSSHLYIKLIIAYIQLLAAMLDIPRNCIKTSIIWTARHVKIKC